MITNTTMKNLSVNASHQYWQHLAYIGKAIWNELFVCLDLCQDRYWSTLTSSSSFPSSSSSSCCWCAKRANEHILTISPLFFLSIHERAHAHTFRHGVMKTNEYEHLFHFIWKRERHWIKNRFIFFFSSSLSLFLLQTRSKRSDNNNNNPSKTCSFVKVTKETLFLPLSIVFP